MTNEEKFKDDIDEVLNLDSDGKFGLYDETDDIFLCNIDYRPCEYCAFRKGDCHDTKNKWLKSEYKEPFKIFEIERDILKFALKNGYRYITRDKCGVVKVHMERPFIACNEMIGFHWTMGKTMHLFDGLFDFVKWDGWEKSKPMLIKSILNNYILK